jgi:hypothetical protein
MRHGNGRHMGFPQPGQVPVSVPLIGAQAQAPQAPSAIQQLWLTVGSLVVGLVDSAKVEPELNGAKFRVTLKKDDREESFEIPMGAMLDKAWLAKEVQDGLSHVLWLFKPQIETGA